MGVMSSGVGIGYERGQYASAHAPPHGMQRQKSIGEAVCFSCLPVPARLSVLWTSEGVHCAELFVCGPQCLVWGQPVGTLPVYSCMSQVLNIRYFYVLTNLWYTQ